MKTFSRAAAVVVVVVEVVVVYWSNVSHGTVGTVT